MTPDWLRFLLTYASLRENRFDDTCGRACWNNSRHRETRVRQERSIFFRCALMSTRDEQHGDVGQLARKWPVTRRDDLFDDEESGSGRWGMCHRHAAIPQNCSGLAVVPIVDDVLEHI